MTLLYQWAVIGAGPAGIAAVGKLIDNDITPSEIFWIDPKFTVGDFGTFWRNVPSNTQVELFHRFLYACHAFNYRNCPIDFEINHRDITKTCLLSMMAEPLQWVTDHLRKSVHSSQNIAETLTLKNRVWNIKLKGSMVQAKNVILAIGAEPKTLSYPEASVIPLQDAMNSVRISKYLNHDDTIGVFGSSHSAILILQHLVEKKIARIINFYRSTLRYAVYLDNWILFDDTGLKGPTAEWARNNIDGQLPPNLLRVYANKENIECYLPQCSKVVYAVGFERRNLPLIQDIEQIAYNEQCGIIAPGLFGLGIAFPEAKYNPIGMLEYRVGLWKFMEYIERVMPIWLKYST